MINKNLNNALILLIKFLFIYFIFLSKLLAVENNKIKDISEGSENAKVEILVYESLTCPHCATFHTEIYPALKKNFIDKGLVKIKFKSFPLDIAALNASKIAHCKNDGKSELLHFLYKNQKKSYNKLRLNFPGLDVHLLRSWTEVFKNRCNRE